MYVGMFKRKECWVGFYMFSFFLILKVFFFYGRSELEIMVGIFFLFSLRSGGFYFGI